MAARKYDRVYKFDDQIRIEDNEAAFFTFSDQAREIYAAGWEKNLFFTRVSISRFSVESVQLRV